MPYLARKEPRGLGKGADEGWLDYLGRVTSLGGGAEDERYAPDMIETIPPNRRKEKSPLELFSPYGNGPYNPNVPGSPEDIAANKDAAENYIIRDNGGNVLGSSGRGADEVLTGQDRDRALAKAIENREKARQSVESGEAETRGGPPPSKRSKPLSKKQEHTSPKSTENPITTATVPDSWGREAVESMIENDQMVRLDEPPIDEDISEAGGAGSSSDAHEYDKEVLRILRMKDEKPTDWGPLLALVDSWTGSKLLPGYTPPRNDPGAMKRALIEDIRKREEMKSKRDYLYAKLAQQKKLREDEFQMAKDLGLVPRGYTPQSVIDATIAEKTARTENIKSLREDRAKMLELKRAGKWSPVDEARLRLIDAQIEKVKADTNKIRSGAGPKSAKQGSVNDAGIDSYAMEMATEFGGMRTFDRKNPPPRIAQLSTVLRNDLLLWLKKHSDKNPASVVEAWKKWSRVPANRDSILRRAGLSK